MTIMKNVMILAYIAMLFKFSIAANYTVGGSNSGWDVSSNLQTWSASQTFLVGDNLIFQYGANHDVIEVSKTDYESCQSTKPIEDHNGGLTIIPLSSPGKRYFTCKTQGHCSLGMKVEINTLSTSTATSPPAAPLSIPSSPSPSPTNPPSLVISPMSSPSPATSSPSTSQSPAISPFMSPPSPPEPVSGSPGLSPLESLASDISFPPPPTSSAMAEKIKTSFTICFNLGMMMMMIVAF